MSDHLGSRVLTLVVMAVGSFMVAPLLLIVPMSFSNSQSLEFPPKGYWLGYYGRFLASDSWLTSVFNSVLIALLTALLTMVIAAPAAFAIVRRNFFGKGFARMIVMLPMVVPSIVMALGYYVYYAIIGLNQSYTGLVLAHTAGALPICFLVLTAALKGFDRNIERAASSLGAHPLRVFFLVTMPVLRPGFLVGALFSFVHSFDEAVIAIFVSGRSIVTLPRKMFDSLTNEADPVIAVVSTLLLVIVLLGGLVHSLANLRGTPEKARVMKSQEAGHV